MKRRKPFFLFVTAKCGGEVLQTRNLDKKDTVVAWSLINVEEDSV